MYITIWPYKVILYSLLLGMNYHINGLEQERRNSGALSMELHILPIDMILQELATSTPCLDSLIFPGHFISPLNDVVTSKQQC